MMKKNIIILLVFVLSFVFAGEVLAGDLIDEKNAYSFQYPVDWQAKMFPDSRDLVKAEMVKNKETGMQVRVYANARSPEDFYEWYVVDFMKQMEDHWGGEIVVLDKKSAEFPGKECIVVAFDFTRRDGTRWFFKQYLWPRQDKMLILQSGTPYRYRSLHEPEFDSIAASLKML